jgi:hypothetical protein
MVVVVLWLMVVPAVVMIMWVLLHFTMGHLIAHILVMYWLLLVL